MRSFIIASILLSLILILTIFNTFYLTSQIDEILTLCEELENGSSTAKAEELLDSWQNCRNIVSLSTHMNDVERVENALFTVNAFDMDTGDFKSQLDILINALEHIRDSQSLTLENIF